MVHTIQWRVASDEALDFWAARLADADVATERREEGALAFADFEDLRHELRAVAVGDAALAAHAPDIPAEHALLGFHGVRAYASRPDASTPLLEAIGFAHDGGADWTLRGEERQAALRYDAPSERRGVTSAGTVHHVAWSAADDAELEAVRARAVDAGARATEIIDRQYFHSVYFREPSGVLFELASRDIGFEYDEPLESLGESLRLPPQYESRREQLEQALTPLTNPRARTTA
jgi:glyoxalase family protein